MRGHGECLWSLSNAFDRRSEFDFEFSPDRFEIKYNPSRLGALDFL